MDYSVDAAANSSASAALNANHTHFILVDSPVAGWGQEITYVFHFLISFY